MNTPHTAGRRRAERPRRSGRVRTLLALAAVAVLATGLSVKGTFAFWTDTATLKSGSFTSGTLDITLAGALAGPAGNGGTTTPAAFVLTNLSPGESHAYAFPVANAGSVPLTYSVGATAAGDLAPHMQFSVSFASTASNATAANGLRTGTCSGSATVTNQVWGGGATAVVASANPRTLVASTATGTSTESVCVVARLNPNADNGAQGKTMSASLVFDAKQIGA